MVKGYELAQKISASYDSPETNLFVNPQTKKRFKLTGPIGILDSILQNIKIGHLSILCPDGTGLFYGDRDSKLQARVLIKDQRWFSRILRGSSLALGESYVDGWWEVENDRICDFIGILLSNRLHEFVKPGFLLSIKLAWERIKYLPLTIAKAKDDIKHHYDLGNDFYSMFLDSSMTYSCGYQTHPGDSIDDMQYQKHQLVCNKLGLDRSGRLLDIGCGWGSLLIHAAQHYRHITGLGITLSRNQFEYAKERILSERLENRLEVRLKDYREIKGMFDFVSSIGMFEHVSKPCYGEFIRDLNMLLKPNGVGLLHTIALSDPPETPPDPWIQRHIFPGTRLPRLQEIVEEMNRYGLTIAHVENLKPHYAETLRLWRKKFEQNKRRIRLLRANYDERFLRTWKYYFQSCEAGFRYSSLNVYQILFSKGNRWPFPLQFGSFMVN